MRKEYQARLSFFARHSVKVERKSFHSPAASESLLCWCKEVTKKHLIKEERREPAYEELHSQAHRRAAPGLTHRGNNNIAIKQIPLSRRANAL
jgi:hypothetical protein